MNDLLKGETRLVERVEMCEAHLSLNRFLYLDDRQVKNDVAIRKNSIDCDEKGEERIFVRDDLVYTDEAIEKEGVKVL